MKASKPSLSLRAFQIGMEKLVQARFPGQEKFTAKQIADREQVYYEVLRGRLTDKLFAKAIYSGMESWRFFPATADILDAARLAERSGVGGSGRVLSMEEAHEKQKQLEAQWAEGSGVMEKIAQLAQKHHPKLLAAGTPFAFPKRNVLHLPEAELSEEELQANADRFEELKQQAIDRMRTDPRWRALVLRERENATSPELEP